MNKYHPDYDDYDRNEHAKAALLPWSSWNVCDDPDADDLIWSDGIIYENLQEANSELTQIFERLLWNDLDLIKPALKIVADRLTEPKEKFAFGFIAGDLDLVKNYRNGLDYLPFFMDENEDNVEEVDTNWMYKLLFLSYLDIVSIERLCRRSAGLISVAAYLGDLKLVNIKMLLATFMDTQNQTKRF